VYYVIERRAASLDGRGRRKEDAPDLAMLALQLLIRLQNELFACMAADGFDDVRPRHGTVLACLDGEGTRPVDLARRSGRRKQALAAIIDDLVRLGYVVRRPDPLDRRGKLVLPTERGLAWMETSDRVMQGIEVSLAASIGDEDFLHSRAQIAGLVAALEPRPAGSGRRSCPLGPQQR
jgi:DNA-binding MarR family transcriptional regulator